MKYCDRLPGSWHFESFYPHDEKKLISLCDFWEGIDARNSLKPDLEHITRYCGLQRPKRVAELWDLKLKLSRGYYRRSTSRFWLKSKKRKYVFT